MRNSLMFKRMTVARLMAIMSFPLCGVLASVVIADASADAIMFRKPSAAAPSGSFLSEMAPRPVEKTDKAAEKPTAAEQEKAVADPEKPAEKPEKTVVQPKPADQPKPIEVPVVKVAPAAEVAVPAVKEAVEKKAGDSKPEKKAKAVKQPERDAIITADRTDYDRKEGVVLFDRNVHVDDTQYQMHADRLFLFLDGTNELKRLVAIGHVAITNDDKRAYCARATFSKKLGRVVMYSSDEITAELCEDGKKGSNVKGEKITFWLDSEQVEVENPVITMPGGIGGQGSVKKLIGK